MTKDKLLGMKYAEKVELIKQCRHLDVFADDPDVSIRIIAAKQCCCMAKEIESVFWGKYQERMDSGCDKDIIMYRYNRIKTYVIGYEYGFRKFIRDDDLHVRMVFIDQCYGLEELVDDPSWIIRAAVAKQGYGLSILINDIDPYVRDIASLKFINNTNDCII